MLILPAVHQAPCFSNIRAETKKSGGSLPGPHRSDDGPGKTNDHSEPWLEKRLRAADRWAMAVVSSYSGLFLATSHVSGYNKHAEKGTNYTIRKINLWLKKRSQDKRVIPMNIFVFSIFTLHRDLCEPFHVFSAEQQL